MPKNNKKTIVIFSIPAHGHINPILPIAKELVQRGNKVYFFSLDEFQQVIQATGSIFVAYPPYPLPDFKQIAKYGIRLAGQIIDITQFALKKIDIQKYHPDIIIHDSLALVGKIIASQHSIPAVSFSTTLLITPRVIFRYPFFEKDLLINFLQYGFGIVRKHNIFMKSVGMGNVSFTDILINKEKLNIVFTSREFQPLVYKFDNTFAFIGPSLGKRSYSVPLPTTKQDCIYISLGTIYNDDVQFFNACISAFRDIPYTVYIAIGNTIQLKSLGIIPNNFIIKPHLPQLEILQKAKLFITHGGMNSVMESLYYGVPMIVVPQMFEQKINGLRVQELGAGIVLSSEKVDKETIYKNFKKIITNNSYKESAQSLSLGLRDAGGYQRAVDLILG